MRVFSYICGHNFVVITMKELNSYKEIRLEIPAFASISIRAIWLNSTIA